MNKLKQIKQMPTTHDNVHESIYRASATLELVKDMLKRGDSKESILLVVEDLYTPSETEIRETADSLKKMVDNPHPLIQKELTQQWSKTFHAGQTPEPPFKLQSNKPLSTEV